MNAGEKNLKDQSPTSQEHASSTKVIHHSRKEDSDSVCNTKGSTAAACSTVTGRVTTAAAL